MTLCAGDDATPIGKVTSFEYSASIDVTPTCDSTPISNITIPEEGICFSEIPPVTMEISNIYCCDSLKKLMGPDPKPIAPNRAQRRKQRRKYKKEVE